MSDQQVITAAAASPIVRYSWKDRGHAPIGYIKGMAVAFAGAYRRLTAGEAIAVATAGPLMGDASKDVLDWYADVFVPLAVGHASPQDRLIQLYALMLGLGMRESSGKHCEGRDMSADNVSAESAEAGLFQVSHDSIGATPALPGLFNAYKGRTDLLDIFKEGVTCSAANWDDWGVGPGRDFQTLTKHCPAFAAAYAALLLRHQRRHWGPINRKEAEVRADAVTLLRDIKAIVDQE